MKKIYIFAFSLIALAIISCLNASRQQVFADTYTVTFDYNTERIEKYLPSMMIGNLENQVFEVNSNTVTVPNNVSLSVLNHYDYVWTLDGEVVTPKDNKLSISGDTTFVAQWTPKEYTIYYNYVTDAELSEIKNLKLTDTYSIESPVKFYRPKRDNYAFIDWYKSSAFKSHEIYMYTDTFDMFDKVIYAKWKPIEYYIDYHTDADNKNNPYSYNVESLDYELEAPVKEGHIFKGWYLDKNFIYEYKTIKHGSSGNLDLYPLWELEKYDVKYIMPNGEVQVIETSYGEKAITPKNYNNMFQLVVYDGNRDNIKSDTSITVRYVNIWYLYLIGLIIIAGIVTICIVSHYRKNKQLHKLRYVYHSNYKRK